jgi:hypothetical protein
MGSYAVSPGKMPGGTALSRVVDDHENRSGAGIPAEIRFGKERFPT